MAVTGLDNIYTDDRPPRAATTIVERGTHSEFRIQNSAFRSRHPLRQAAGKAVGSVFFGTLLKMVRNAELQGPYGHGGRGEKVFAAQLHGIFAEQLGQRIKTPIGDAIIRNLDAQQERVNRQKRAPDSELHLPPQKVAGFNAASNAASAGARPEGTRGLPGTSFPGGGAPEPLPPGARTSLSRAAQPQDPADKLPD